MARPKKNPAQVKSFFLRIPLTEEQKTTIQQAAESTESDMAPWARETLMQAAAKQLGKNDRKQKKK